MFSIYRRWRRRRLLRRPLPDGWRALALTSFPWLEALEAAERTRFFDHLKLFVWEKHWFGAGGLALDETMQVVIAGCAARLSRNLPLSAYDHLTEVVVYPGAFIRPDEEGYVYDGEAHTFGTIVLSWAAVAEDVAYPGEVNTALHELAHVLDVAAGDFNGTPALADRASYERWRDVFTRHYLALQEAREEGAIDLYGAQDEAEFFAVVTEAFFERPLALAAQAPDLYALLVHYYRTDEARLWRPQAGAPPAWLAAYDWIDADAPDDAPWDDAADATADDAAPLSITASGADPVEALSALAAETSPLTDPARWPDAVSWDDDPDA